MLKFLRIENLILIESIEIEFQTGLNIVSGETGTGKSLLIEAISLLLGGRAHQNLLRLESKEATVEGLFHLKGQKELLIRRSILRNAKSKILINGQTATLAKLQKVAQGLIDLCGQAENQILVKAHYQIDLLDSFAQVEKPLGEFQKKFKLYQEELSQVKKIEKELENTNSFSDQAFYKDSNGDSNRESLVELLRFQVEEIKTASIEEGEDLKLQEKKQKLLRDEKKRDAFETCIGLLDSEQEGVLSRLKKMQRSLEKIDLPLFKDYCLLLETSTIQLEELSLGLNQELSLELRQEQEAELRQIQERLAKLALLKRKYGGSLGEIELRLTQFESRLLFLENLEAQYHLLLKALEERRREVFQLAQILSKLRAEAALVLEKATTIELQDMNMQGAKLRIDLTFSQDIQYWSLRGGDYVSFCIQTNAGEALAPLSQIASGGELSRILLALRRVIGTQGDIDVYLFDEIDAGIGGQTAFQVGKKLKSVALNKQVICITHLPQIAAFADRHWLVQKKSLKNKTYTEIILLNDKEQVNELARMLGGPSLTKKSQENAIELMQLAKNLRIDS